ncbi:MAG TPA: magnesium-translocating P-type ATPase [Pirellulales bacterium]|jgi:Mg2+-importing ATPase
MALSTAEFWSVPSSILLEQLGSSATGLSTHEASIRERLAGRRFHATRPSDLALLLNQFKSPILVILFVCATMAFALGGHTDAAIIIFILLASSGLGFWQERTAADAVNRLLARITTTAKVLRDGRPVELPLNAVVQGDVVLLSAGDAIPGDCRILESRNLFVDEATLTGETFPAEKQPADLPRDTVLAARSNSLFLGTHVVSGQGTALAVEVGNNTEFGRVSNRLAHRAPETAFEHGVRRFGYFLLNVTLLLVIVIFAVNVYSERPVLQAFMFSLALAVGLTPQLLPAIISVNLAHGARRMAEQKVIVRRLASIENFGSMNVLCSDKTGTLTEGTMRLVSALDVTGHPSEKVILLAHWNAVHETGFVNPIDTALRACCSGESTSHEKLDEIPYDFIRKRLSVLVRAFGSSLLISKGAVPKILEVCALAEDAGGVVVPMASVRSRVEEQYEQFGRKGLRALAVAYRNLGDAREATKESEVEMILLGLLALEDPLKPDIAATVESLAKLGVALKVVTGDSRSVAASIAAKVGLDCGGLLTGGELRHLSDEALLNRVNTTGVFAEIEPNQKERLISALRKTGNVVGYIGDGINDASALHAADVGISVDTAVDVAKEAADIVLLEHNLAVLCEGVREGRKTFANTLKYVFMATSANFGNMLSMALSSIYLPFLPLLPKQILLTNLLTDLPEMFIATDSVDPEAVLQPQRWNVPMIRRFMLVFGTISSVFDVITFVVLWRLGANETWFRTGWFLESVVSACLIVLVIRSRRLFFRSRPSRALLLATAIVVLVTVVLPWTPLGRPFEFQPLPWGYLVAIAVIVAAYVLTAETAKPFFYRRRNRPFEDRV